MITIVLGAGASCHHGFPTGAGLKHDIIEALAKDNNSQLATALRMTKRGMPADLPRSFAYALRAHIGGSVDAFLQTRAHRTQFYEIAKLAIAAELLKRERSNVVYHQDCWYRYLLARILPDNHDDFDDTGVRIVTFNFDRSFEYAARYHAAATWAVSVEKAQAILAKVLPIAHVHGSLQGEYGRHGADEGVLLRPPDPATIAESAAAIAVAGDSLGLPDRELALEWISKSAALVFLGFRFHDFALKHLELPSSFRGELVTGTCMGMDPGYVAFAQSLFRQNASFLDMQILRFLQVNPVLHLPEYRAR